MKSITEFDELQIETHQKQQRKGLANMSLEETSNLSIKSLKTVVHQTKMIEELKKLQHINKINDEDSFDADEIDDPYEMEDFVPGAKN